MTKTTTYMPHAGRFAELVLGVVFLAGALLKALDFNLFTVQIRAYGVLEQPQYLAVAAFGTLFLETSLGAALLAGARLRGATHAAIAALLVFFTGLILYGWIAHDLEDCGCFGPIEMSPGISTAKNIILLAFAAAAWAGYRIKPDQESTISRASGLKAAVSALLAVALTVYAASTLERIVPPGEEDRPFAQFVFEADGQAFDLGAGEHLVVMLNMTCDHCMASVEPLNELFYMQDFPAIVALCYEEEEGELDEFLELTQPLFPLHSLGDRVRTFFNFVGEKGPPRFILVRDGRQLVFWDEEPPDAEHVFRALAAME